MNLGFRIFYESDVRPWLASRRNEIHDAYVGPGWRHINGYERLGRLVWGTALILLWIVLCAATGLFFLAIVVTVVEAVACLFKPGCTVSFRPPQ
jgi:hypothetical protein